MILSLHNFRDVDKIRVRLRPGDRVIVLGGWTAIERIQAEHERAIEVERELARLHRHSTGDLAMSTDDQCARRE